MRVEHNHGELRLVRIARRQFSALATGVNRLIDFFQTDTRTFGSSTLQVQVERRIDAVTLGEQFTIRKMVRELIPHHVHKIGRLAGLCIALCKSQGQLDRLVGLRRRNVAVLSHFLQHPVPALRRAFGMAVWIVETWTPNDPRK